MKGYLYILAIPLLLLNCKKEKDPAPLPVIEEIVGKWRLDAVEKTVNGQKVWDNVTSEPASYLIFRFDGVILDGNGLAYCCAPGALIIQGTTFKIKPRAEIPENPQCYFVDCVACSAWDLEQKENELVLTPKCESPRYRYRRE